MDLSFLSVRLDSKRVWCLCPNLGPVHCSRDPQTHFFNKIFIKNRFHNAIHTFKNDFITLFSVFSFQFSSISSIQIDQKYEKMGLEHVHRMAIGANHKELESL